MYANPWQPCFIPDTRTYIAEAEEETCGATDQIWGLGWDHCVNKGGGAQGGSCTDLVPGYTVPWAEMGDSVTNEVSPLVGNSTRCCAL